MRKKSISITTTEPRSIKAAKNCTPKSKKEDSIMPFRKKSAKSINTNSLMILLFLKSLSFLTKVPKEASLINSNQS